MILVDSQGRLEEMVGSTRAIAFIHFDWSGQSFQSLNVVEKLEQSLSTRVGVFRLEPDHGAEGAAWLSKASAIHKEEVAGGGFGAVLWLREGRLVDWVRFAAGSGLEDLMERSRKAFS